MTKELPFHAVETTAQGFAELGLAPEILKVLDEVGFKHPTPIQAKAIPIALNGHDVMGCAQTGTGKTAAFVLPLVHKLTHGKGTRGLILCPTREIALQTHQFVEFFGESHQLTGAVLIGGVKYGPQEEALRNIPDIIIATPGRLMDHVKKRNVSLKMVEELVMDEADRMLDMGFYPQIEKILRQLPANHRTMMFSATMPPSIKRLADHFLEAPEYIEVAPPGTSAHGIEHRVYLVEETDRERMLLALVKAESGSVLVFAQTKREVDALTKMLGDNGEPAKEIHSDRSQSQRVAALEGFREGKHSVLVATDVMSRGIDITGISQIISYQVPENAEDYVHRSGRTGRAGHKGISSVIATWKDKSKVAYVESLLGSKFSRCTMEGIEPYVEQSKKKRSKLRGW